MKIQYVTIHVAAVFLLGLASNWSQAQAGEDGIGLYGTVEGTVTVARVGDTLGRPVKLQDPVFFQDMIETQNESRTKALFDDDTILTVGENSKVKITEYVYNPDQNIRSAVVHLLEGRLRALVAKAFKGPGSKFEIRTPTAVAAARGTYFIVWSEGGTSGMVNIGEEGKVDFTSAGKTVTVAPGSYSVALSGQPPSQPTAYQPVADQTAKSGDGSTSNKESASKADGSQQAPYVLTSDADEDDDSKKTKNKRSLDKYREHMKWISKALADTKVKDRPRFEKPMDVLRALRHDGGASSRMAAKLRSDQSAGRVRNDRRFNSVKDGGSGNNEGQDSENNNGNNNANGTGGDSGRGKGDGGSDGSKGPVAKAGDLSGDRGNGDAPKGDKTQGGGEGNNSNGGNGNNGGTGSATVDSPKDKGRGGDGSGDSPKDRGRGDGNSDGPKDRNRGGEGSKVASTNLTGSGPGKIIPIAPLSTPVASAPVASPVAASPVASPMVSTPVVSAPVASPIVAAPVTTAPVLGAPVMPAAPAVPVSPPAVFTGAAKLLQKFENSGKGSGNSGKNK